MVYMVKFCERCPYLRGELREVIAKHYESHAKNFCCIDCPAAKKKPETERVKAPSGQGYYFKLKEPAAEPAAQTAA